MTAVLTSPLSSYSVSLLCSAVIHFLLPGLVLEHTNRLAEAVTLFEETLRQAPAHPSSPLHLATALHSLGRLTEALPVYQAALHLPQGPTNALLLQNFAALLSALGHHQHALAVISEAAALLPEHQDQEGGVRDVQTTYQKQAQGVCCCNCLLSMFVLCCVVLWCEYNVDSSLLSGPSCHVPQAAGSGEPDRGGTAGAVG